MRIRIELAVGGRKVEQSVFEIDDRKLEELTSDELEAAIEMNVRNWANRNIQMEWEVVDDDDDDDDGNV